VNCGRFANELFRQQLVRQHSKSFRQRPTGQFANISIFWGFLYQKGKCDEIHSPDLLTGNIHILRSLKTKITQTTLIKMQR